MAEIPDINPIISPWPVRPSDKPGERKRKQQEQDKKKKKPHESEKNDDGSGIDEYA